MLIENVIPKQGFEIVRDLIGAALFTEIQHQKTINPLIENDPLNIFVGRAHPFHQSEGLMTNVLLDSANYTDSNERSASGSTVFFVDTYCSSKEKPNEDGGYASTVKRDQYTGLIRFILQDHHYKTLGLAAGKIMSTQVESFENFQPTNEKDSAFVKMSRITFSVRINESQSVWDGININSIFTEVKLDLTEKGYQFNNL